MGLQTMTFEAAMAFRYVTVTPRLHWLFFSQARRILRQFCLC